MPQEHGTGRRGAVRERNEARAVHCIGDALVEAQGMSELMG